jgi:hypothetical protein
LSGDAPPAKIHRRVCYALKIVYSSLTAEVTGMSAESRGGLDKSALEEILASSGVKVTSDEVDAVARSLARMRLAAGTLPRSPSFDETVERFYRLLEIDAAGGAGR